MDGLWIHSPNDKWLLLLLIGFQCIQCQQQQQQQYSLAQPNIQVTAFKCDDGCPYSTECNQTTGFCYCSQLYPILVDQSRPCLMRKYLGEFCVHSAQCAHIDDAICIANTRTREELKSIPLMESTFLNRQMIKNPEKFLPRKDYGRCDCRPGYWANPKIAVCRPMRLNSLECSVANRCPDPNSHCDQHRRKCVCDLGHNYSLEHDRCLLNTDMIGVFCKTNSDCQSRDEHSVCILDRCVCINNHYYDSIRGCQSAYHCKEGQTWNEFSKSCEPTTYILYTNGLQFENKEFKRDWHKFTPKMLIFFMSISIMIFMMKNRRSIFPTISHLNLERNRSWNLFSGVSSFPPYDSRRLSAAGFDHRVRVPASAFNSAAHAAHLTGSHDSSLMGPPWTRRLSMESNLSLPAYEPPSNGQEGPARTDSPPPSYDELPSYEQAIKCVDSKASDQPGPSPSKPS